MQVMNKCSTVETTKSNNYRNAVMRSLDWLLAVGKLFLMGL